MHSLQNMPIGRRLSLLVFSISTITLGLVLTLALFSASMTLRDETRATLMERNESVADSLDRRLHNLTFTLDRIVRNTMNGSDPSEADVAQSVGEIMRLETNLILRRLVYFRPGQVVQVYNFPNPATGRSMLRQSVPDSAPDPNAWYVRALSDERIDQDGYQWYGPQRAVFSAQGEDVVSLALPYRSIDGQPIGLLWADVALNNLDLALRDTLENESFLIEQDNAFSVVLGQNGLPVAAFNLRASPVSLDEITTLSQPDTITEMGYIGGRGSMFGLNSEMMQTGWRLITLYPDAELPVLPSRAILSIMLVSAVGIGALLWVIMRFVAQTVGQPLHHLSETAQRIGAGEMQHEIGWQDRTDEIGVLARALEEMRQNLRESYDSLEQRVIDRTAELQVAQREAQSNAAELRAVYDESLVVVNDFHLHTILEAFTQRILTLLQADYCGVWLLRKGGDQLRLVAHTEPDRGLSGLVVQVGEGVVGKAVAERRTLRVDDYRQWPNRLELANNRHMVRALAVPLVSAAQVVGAVIVGRGAQGAVFSESQQRLLTLFANLVAPSVRSAQLYAELDEARREADRANQVKTRFLASVTHELRTPLNLIINNMDFMRIGAFGEVSSEQINRLDQTIRSAEHLLYLINDLLDVSKIEAGEMHLFVQPTDVYPVIEDAIDSSLVLLDKDDKGARVAITADIPADLPHIPMDARRVRQVLFNLLSNAVKFTQEGEVHLDVLLHDGHLVFSVRDTGIGMSEDEQVHLFEAFERAPTAKHLGIEGTGLGLPISRYLVEAHGGTLTFQTEAGKGSTFTFTIPMRPVIDKRMTITEAIAVKLDG